MVTGRLSIVAFQGIFANETYFNTNVTNIGPGANRYRWTITKNDCTSFDDVDITNNTVATPYAGVDQSVCTDTTTLFAADPSPASGEWFVSGGSASVTDLTMQTSHVTGLGVGDNSFTWVVSYNGCTASDEVKVAFDEPSVADAGLDQVVCENETVLSAREPEFATGNSGSWTIEEGGSSLVVSTLYNTQVIDLSSGINRFRWTVSKGNCAKTDEVVITNNKVVANAGSDEVICEDDVRLSASDPTVGIGHWVGVGGNGIIAIDTKFNTQVTNLSFGVNKFRWTVTQGECTEVSDVVIESYKFDVRGVYFV